MQGAPYYKFINNWKNNKKILDKVIAISRIKNEFEFLKLVVRVKLFMLTILCKLISASHIKGGHLLSHGHPRYFAGVYIIKAGNILPIICSRVEVGCVKKDKITSYLTLYEKSYEKHRVCHKHSFLYYLMVLRLNRLRYIMDVLNCKLKPGNMYGLLKRKKFSLNLPVSLITGKVV
jgi:hypothetical protein